MENKKFGVLSSSVNPQELSLTVQAVARAVISIGVSFGIFEATGADSAVEQIGLTVTTGYAAWQFLEAVWGGVRKIIVALAPKL
jgi:hypothetical protein